MAANLGLFCGICKCCASHWLIGVQRNMHRLLLLSQWPNKGECVPMKTNQWKRYAMACELPLRWSELQRLLIENSPSRVLEER